MPHSVNIVTSVLSSTIRRWRGASGSKAVQQPAKLIELYDLLKCIIRDLQ